MTLSLREQCGQANRPTSGEQGCSPLRLRIQRDKRLFLTTTWQPFNGTTVRAYVEMTDASGRRPNNRTVQDAASEWLNAYNTYAPLMTQAQINAAFFWNAAVPSNGGIPPSSNFTLGDGTTVDLGLIRRPLDSRPNGTTLIYSGNGNCDNGFSPTSPCPRGARRFDMFWIGQLCS